MLISEFQAGTSHMAPGGLYYLPGFQFSEIKPYIRHGGQHVRRFNIQQWCPIAERWYEVLIPGNWHQNFESKDNTPVNDNVCIIKPALLKALRNPPKAVIVCPEKHGTQYFSANSTEEIGMVALQIVKERHKQGYYSLVAEPTEPDRKPEDFPDAPKFAVIAEKEWEIYESNLRQYKEEKAFMKVLDRTLAENHYNSAVHLLESHTGYEYEGFRIEELTVLDPR